MHPGPAHRDRTGQGLAPGPAVPWRALRAVSSKFSRALGNQCGPRAGGRGPGLALTGCRWRRLDTVPVGSCSTKGRDSAGGDSGSESGVRRGEREADPSPTLHSSCCGQKGWHRAAAGPRCYSLPMPQLLNQRAQGAPLGAPLPGPGPCCAGGPLQGAGPAGGSGAERVLQSTCPAQPRLPGESRTPRLGGPSPGVGPWTHPAVGDAQ